MVLEVKHTEEGEYKAEKMARFILPLMFLGCEIMEKAGFESLKFEGFISLE